MQFNAILISNFPIPELIPLASLCSIEGIVMIVPIVSSRSFQEIQHAKERKFPKQIFNFTSIIRWFGSFCSSIVPQDRKSSLHLAVAVGILETLPNDSVTVHSPIAATAVTAPSAKPGSPLPTTHHHPRPAANLSNYLYNWIWSEKMFKGFQSTRLTLTATINVIKLLSFTFTNFPFMQIVLSSSRSSILCNVPRTIGAVLG